MCLHSPVGKKVLLCLSSFLLPSSLPSCIVLSVLVEELKSYKYIELVLGCGNVCA